MNLSGSNQRLAACNEGQNGRGTPAGRVQVPTSLGNPIPLNTAARTGEDPQREWLRKTPAWRASVWDEVQAMANGTLLRRIRILITDGTQLESEEIVWG